MANVTAQNQSTPPATGVKAISQFFNQDNVKAKFAEVLGQKSTQFIASVLSLVSSNQSLANVDQNSIYMAAMMAASLDLTINQNLGHAYIVPYGGKAQFQLGYKGFKQLAQRSGQFLTINDTDIREGEIKSHNRLSGEIVFEFIQNPTERLSKKVVGYASYFKLLNGFESTFYMTAEEIEVHAKKYSQTYKKYSTGLWKDEKDSMARKTVTKLNLSKNAPLSIEMQRAVTADQAVIKNFDPANEETLDIEPEYVDNPDTKENQVENTKDEIKEAQKAGTQGKIDIP